VALDGQTIVFVEVKSKLTDRFGRPEEAVNWKKRWKLSRVALSYLLSKHSLDKPARFDVVAVGINAKGPADIVLFKNAFELAGS